MSNWSNNMLQWMKYSQTEEGLIDNEENMVSHAASVPEYVIKVDKVFRTTMAGFENYAKCEGYEIGSLRSSSVNPLNYFDGDRGIKARKVLVCMKYTQGMPNLHQLLLGGTCVEEINIKRLASLRESFLEVQSLTFNKCFLTTYEQKNKLIFFSFSFTKMTDAQTIYDSSGERLSGISASEYNFETFLLDTTPKNPNIDDNT